MSESSPKGSVAQSPARPDASPDDGLADQHGMSMYETDVKEQDRYLPIANGVCTKLFISPSTLMSLRTSTTANAHFYFHTSVCL